MLCTFCTIYNLRVVILESIRTWIRLLIELIWFIRINNFYFLFILLFNFTSISISSLSWPTSTSTSDSWLLIQVLLDLHMTNSHSRTQEHHFSYDLKILYNSFNQKVAMFSWISKMIVMNIYSIHKYFMKLGLIL